MTPASDLSVAEYFARLASSYGAGEYYRKRRVAAVAELGRRLGKIESLLDLGCGNGTYLSGFREVVDPKFLVGADLSFRMAQEALRRGATNAIVCGDRTLPRSRGHLRYSGRRIWGSRTTENPAGRCTLVRIQG